MYSSRTQCNAVEVSPLLAQFANAERAGWYLHRTEKVVPSCVARLLTGKENSVTCRAHADGARKAQQMLAFLLGPS